MEDSNTYYRKDKCDCALDTVKDNTEDINDAQTLFEEHLHDAQANPNKTYFLTSFISLVFPVIGLIIFLLNKKTNQLKAVTALKWSIVGFTINVVAGLMSQFR